MYEDFPIIDSYKKQTQIKKRLAFITHQKQKLINLQRKVDVATHSCGSQFATTRLSPEVYFFLFHNIFYICLAGDQIDFYFKKTRERNIRHKRGNEAVDKSKNQRRSSAATFSVDIVSELIEGNHKNMTKQLLFS